MTVKFNPFKDRWIRLDVDNPSTNRLLNHAHLVLNLPIPRKLHHLREAMRVIPADIPQIWFFRKWTCPDIFERPFGAHLTSPETTEEEIRTVRKKLGEFKYFTRHGYSKRKSGRLWTEDEILKVEEEYGIIDLTDIPHFTVSRTKLFDRRSHVCVLIHPCHVETYRDEIEHVIKTYFLNEGLK